MKLVCLWCSLCDGKKLELIDQNCSFSLCELGHLQSSFIFVGVFLISEESCPLFSILQ